MHTASYIPVTGLLGQIPASSPQFIPTLTSEIQNFGNRFLAASGEDERWSLVDCGLRESVWQKILEWAARCPGTECPRANSRMAGIVLLVVGAAVSRTLDMEDPLWERVADACSPTLRASLFRSGMYPIQEARDSLADTCLSLGLRHQLDLPGKHRFWRTVQLQVGFSGKSGVARLWAWLAGFSMPETMKTLLGETGYNGSDSFKRLWWLLHKWSASLNDADIEEDLLRNPWYPSEAHSAIKASLSGDRKFALPGIGMLDDNPVSTLLSTAKFKKREFEIRLSDFLPGEVAASAASTLRLYVEGFNEVLRLIRNEDGSRELEGGCLRIGVWNALQNPTRDVRVIGQSGTVYKERLELWPDDLDVLLWEESTGRLVRDLTRFQAEGGRGYSLITRSEARIFTNLGEVNCLDRSDYWSLYSFPHGFPPAMEVILDGSAIWAPELPPIATMTLKGSSLRIRELSINSLSVEVIAPPGWAIDGFRFCGRRFTGRTTQIDISPIRKYENRVAHLSLHRGEEKLTVSCRSERASERVTGAAFQDGAGDWHPILQGKALDGGNLDGRILATSWSEDQSADPWLTLDSQPLLALPRSSRRQRYIACGESLQLRFGLMNEVTTSRITLAPAVYSTGMLAAVLEEPGRYLLILREPIEAIDDLRIWVWEQGSPLPRRLISDAVTPQSDNQGFSVSSHSVAGPMGWAIELDGGWRGARFHVEPHSKTWPLLCDAWTNTLNRDSGWYATASALRWWRFPALMKPFREPVQAQASQFRIETFKAWIDSASLVGPGVSREALEFYINPLRIFLWNWQPEAGECMQIWTDFQSEVTTAFEKGIISLSTTLLSIAHPVLLAKIVCEILWTNLREAEAKVPTVLDNKLFRKIRSPLQISRIETEYRALFGHVADLIEQNAGYGKPPTGMSSYQYLRSEALSELKSWTDARPLDDSFFQENILRPAELLFDGEPADTNRLIVAVSRSRACCAFLVSYLLKLKGLKKYE
jgi:hypothetical protein